MNHLYSGGVWRLELRESNPLWTVSKQNGKNSDSEGLSRSRAPYSARLLYCRPLNGWVAKRDWYLR